MALYRSWPRVADWVSVSCWVWTQEGSVLCPHGTCRSCSILSCQVFWGLVHNRASIHICQTKFKIPKHIIREAWDTSLKECLIGMALIPSLLFFLQSFISNFFRHTKQQESLTEYPYNNHLACIIDSIIKCVFMYLQYIYPSTHPSVHITSPSLPFQHNQCLRDLQLGDQIWD